MASSVSSTAPSAIAFEAVAVPAARSNPRYSVIFTKVGEDDPLMLYRTESDMIGIRQGYMRFGERFYDRWNFNESHLGGLFVNPFLGLSSERLSLIHRHVKQLVKPSVSTNFATLSVQAELTIREKVLPINSVREQSFLPSSHGPDIRMTHPLNMLDELDYYPHEYKLVPLAALLPSHNITSCDLGMSVPRLKQLISEKGFDMSYSVICVAPRGDNYLVMDGHHRIKALAELGVDMIPVMVDSKPVLRLEPYCDNAMEFWRKDLTPRLCTFL